jgi:dihydropyrimidinase
VIQPEGPSRLDMVVSGGTLVTGEGSVLAADLGVAGGRIVAIGEHGTLGAAPEVLDATGLHVLPGLVDGHVHVALPLGEFTTRDGFAEASLAAAFGGVTTLVDFAIPNQHESPRDAIERRMEEAAGQCYVDYAFHATVARSVPAAVLDDVPRLVSEGFPTVKAFTVYRDLVMVEIAEVLDLMRVLARHGGLLLVHAETASIIERSIASLVAEGRTGPEFHPRSRPAIAETDTVRSVIGFVEETGCPVWFVHLSAQGSPRLVAEARARGHPVYAETCPHYLLLDQSLYAGEHGERFICSPPVRGAAEREALWDGLVRGHVQMVNTDHCCYDSGQKALHRDFFPAAPNGLPGVETRLRLMLTEGYHSGRLPLDHLVRLMSGNPARLLGCHPQKGALAVGSDADLALVDLDRTGVIRSGQLHMATDYTPFEGRRYRGDVVATVCRGRVVVRDGRVVGSPGHGRLLRRRLQPRTLPA